jgi:hypothetical protein
MFSSRMTGEKRKEGGALSTCSHEQRRGASFGFPNVRVTFGHRALSEQLAYDRSVPALHGHVQGCGSIFDPSAVRVGAKLEQQPGHSKPTVFASQREWGHTCVGCCRWARSRGQLCHVSCQRQMMRFSKWDMNGRVRLPFAGLKVEQRGRLLAPVLYCVPAFLHTPTFRTGTFEACHPTHMHTASLHETLTTQHPDLNFPRGRALELEN